MTNQQILTKVIGKAIEGGWVIRSVTWIYKDSADEWLFINDGSVEKLIFNHEFARALWGERELAMFHLQQMVIKDDPIKYLGKNI